MDNQFQQPNQFQRPQEQIVLQPNKKIWPYVITALVVIGGILGFAFVPGFLNKIKTVVIETQVSEGRIFIMQSAKVQEIVKGGVVIQGFAKSQETSESKKVRVVLKIDSQTDVFRLNVPISLEKVKSGRAFYTTPGIVEAKASDLVPGVRIGWIETVEDILSISEARAMRIVYVNYEFTSE